MKETGGNSIRLPRWSRNALILLLVIGVAAFLFLPESPFDRWLGLQRHPPVEREDGVNRLITANGETLIDTAVSLPVKTFFIDANGRSYRVIRRRGAVSTAEPHRLDPADWSPEAVVETAVPRGSPERTAGIYFTHDAEDFLPTSGVSSNPRGGAVIDVGRVLGESLRSVGFNVVVDETSHLPHDASSYLRSQRTAQRLVREEFPAFLLDIHRDSAPAAAYRMQIRGEETARILIVLGQTNPNNRANLDFARSLRQTADDFYPGLVRGIVYFPYHYNQMIHPRALLLEVGTVHQRQEEAERGAELIARMFGYLFGHLQP